ncbi:MAG: hypothetical protein ABIR16_00520 [Dokdonella sp.]
MSSSNPNYQVNYGNVGTFGNAAPAAPVRADPDAPMFASEDGLVASLSNSECIFQVKTTGETHVMTYQVLQALDQCREFRSMDEHVARIMTTLSGGQVSREAVTHIMQSLNDKGLLTEDRQFLERLAAEPTQELAPLRAVFVRACDRPSQLERLFASLADYERRFRAGRRYVVIDDSTNPEAANKHRDTVREFARNTGCKLTYLGAAEQARLIERLAKAVPEAAAMLPQLLTRNGDSERFGGGRAWNLALLLSAGGRMVLLDDDQSLPLRRHETAIDGLNPDPSASAFARYFRNTEEALTAGDDIGVDPFEMHLEAAGQMLGPLTANDRYGIDRNALRGQTLGRLNDLRSGANVIATMQGTTGSSRTESGMWMYQMDAESRADFTRDRDSYLRNVEARSLWYGYNQARVTPIATFTPFMLDNSRLLPSTNPFGRGEDALFSATTRLCHPKSMVLELPVAIGHLQETPRKRSDKTVAAHTPRFNHYVSDYIQRQLPDFFSSDPGQRLRLLAAHLRDAAESTPKMRENQLQEYLSFVRADVIERFQQQYELASDAPIYWQADARSIIESNGRALITPGTPRLGDWSPDIDTATAVETFRDDLNQLASAFDVWPALWIHARDQGENLLSGL